MRWVLGVLVAVWLTTEAAAWDWVLCQAALEAAAVLPVAGLVQ